MPTNKMTTDEMLESCAEIEPKTLLNIGVGPVPHNEAEVFQARWPKMRIIGLEPHINIFRERASKYPGKIYPWGLWSTPCLKILSMVRKSKGKSSMLAPDDRWVGKWSYKQKTTCSKGIVCCTTLDHLDEVLKFPEDIFLWMDIEGSELEALKGGHKLLGSGRVKWINLEVSIQPRRVGEPSENELSDYLGRYGFSIYLRYDIGTHFQNVVYMQENNVHKTAHLHIKGVK